MSVVVGTAGHIDHGKTALLRALTGIDADRLPEEQRRGITIDVGYAHLALPDGPVVDFVDVPGHDRLVGNMLVGAGEIDAAMLVVAADDGPNAQTREHLELLDALGIRDGFAVVTKADLAPEAERRAALATGVAALLGRTSLAGSPVLVASAVTGEGLSDVRDAVVALGARLAPRLPATGAPRLAIDRVFAVRGRGTVVTGSLRGGRVTPGMTLRLLPEGLDVRVREVQVRGATVGVADGGRTALLLGGVEVGALRRGQVLTTDPAVVATSRVLGAVRAPASLDPSRPSPAVPADRERLRLHLGTAQAAALVVRGPREATDLPDGSSLALLRLDGPIAAAPGDAFALRRPSPGSTAGGGVILDPIPPRGVSRRRLTRERAAALLAAPPGSDAARVDLHGAVHRTDGWALAGDVEAALLERAREVVARHHAADAASPGMPVAGLRRQLALAARRLVTLGRTAADEVARLMVDEAVARSLLAREGDRVRDPGRTAGLPPATLAAMDRLEAALAVAAPPALADAALAAACPPEGVRALEAAGRIVRLEDDLGWAATTYRDLAKRALAMAAAGPLTPAAFRDATGTSRRYVLVILEDLDRRGLLRRTDVGHVLGPKTLERLRARAAGGRVREPRMITAIVLAGGASARFGGDKLAADLEGRPVLHHALEAVAEVADDLVVVIGPESPEPALPPSLAARITIARDAAANAGPLAGTAAGLDAVPDYPPRIALVVGGDMPFLVPSVLRLLADGLASAEGLVAMTLEASTPSPLPMALKAAEAREAVAACLAGGRRSLRALLDAVPSAALPAAEWRALDPDGRTLRDVDTPRDLEER